MDAIDAAAAVTVDAVLAEQLGAKVRAPPRLKRSQTTTAILEHPTAVDAVERLSSVGASSVRGRLGLLPRRRETSSRLARQPSTLKAVTEQRHKSTDKRDATTEDAHDDGSSLYFAIETRLELKERLAAVQKQLDGVLMRAKLAWMRCFSSPSSPEQQQQPASPSRSVSDDCGHDVMAWAGELVERVEALAADLTAAFDRATSTDSNNSLDEYKTLVQRAEQQLASLLVLADRIASAHPDCFRRQERSAAADPVENQEAAKPTCSPTRSVMEGVAYPSAPVAFDLPSMKKYCARVAPPYAAYLPSKQDKHRGR